MAQIGLDPGVPGPGSYVADALAPELLDGSDLSSTGQGSWVSVSRPGVVAVELVTGTCTGTGTSFDLAIEAADDASGTNAHAIGKFATLDQDDDDVTKVITAETYKPYVRANYVIAAAFAISGLLAAVVSLLYVAQTSVLSFHMGVPLVLFAFVATVVGGMGSLVGAVLGGFVVGVGSVFFQVILPEAWRSNRDVWVYALVLLILLFRSSGLVKSKTFEEKV